MTTYTMEARENYDAATVTRIDNGEINTTPDQKIANTDNQVVGVAYDFLRRKIIYTAYEYDNIRQAGVPSLNYVNPTGFNLWTGVNLITAGSTISGNGATSPFIGQKDIDTDAVTWFNTYSSTATVPANAGNLSFSMANRGSGYTTATVAFSGGGGTGLAGTLIIDGGAIQMVIITDWGTGYSSPPTCMVSGDGTSGAITASYNGNSDGTWRRLGFDFSLFGGNSPNIVNPHNNDIFAHSQSCELYQFRYADNFAQVISPFTYTSSLGTRNIHPFGVDGTWCYSYVLGADNTFDELFKIVLVPAAITSDEITADQKLPYASYLTSVVLGTITAFRTCFGTDGNIYFFTLLTDAIDGFSFKLIKFEPPAFAAFGSVTGGTFTDITPWTTDGPNADGPPYTFITGYEAANTGPSPFAVCSLFRLPTSNRAVAIVKFQKEYFGSGGDTDYNNTFFSAVDLQLGGSPSFSYHSAFVGGYMKSDWTKTSDVNQAAYAVVNYRELNTFLEQSDYVYSADYAKRWLYFDCYPVSAGTVNTASGLKQVLVQYQFSYGSSPIALQVIDEEGWDSSYTAYATAISNPYVVSNSLFQDIDAGDDYGYLSLYRETGLYDETTDSHWWSGFTHLPEDVAKFNNMFLLDSAFTPRAALNKPTNSGALIQIGAPFLRLSVSTPAPSSLGNAFMIERMDNRIWAAAENTWCVDCGLTTDLPKPDTALSCSSATGAGIPLSIAIDVAGQGYSTGTTAEINDPTGSGAVVAVTVSSGFVVSAIPSGGTNYTRPVVVFTDPAQTGGGASATVTLDNSANFIADTAVFDSGMVGQVIRMGGGKATITAFTDSTHVTGNITAPIVAVIPNTRSAANPGGIPALAESGDWSVAPEIMTVGGLWHLIGFTVTGIADGAPISPRVVGSDGTITLDDPASLVTVGLGFLPQFQSLYLDAGNPTVQGQRKKVAGATVRLESTGVAGVVVGANQPDGAALNPPQVEVTWSNMASVSLAPNQNLPPFGSTTPPLFTGDTLQIPITSGFGKPGQVALQQNLPVPLNVLAIVPAVLPGDSPEETYSPDRKRGG